MFNTDPYNLNDAGLLSCCGRPVGIGGGGYSAAGVIAPGAWNRLAIVVDLAANTLTYYVTAPASKRALGMVWVGAGRFIPIRTSVLTFSLLNEGDTGGIYTHELYLSSVAFVDR